MYVTILRRANILFVLLYLLVADTIFILRDATISRCCLAKFIRLLTAFAALKNLMIVGILILDRESFINSFHKLNNLDFLISAMQSLDEVDVYFAEFYKVTTQVIYNI